VRSLASIPGIAPLDESSRCDARDVLIGYTATELDVLQRRSSRTCFDDLVLSTVHGGRQLLLMCPSDGWLAVFPIDEVVGIKADLLRGLPGGGGFLRVGPTRSNLVILLAPQELCVYRSQYPR